MPKRSKTVEFPRYTLEKCEEWLEAASPSKPVDKDTLSKEIMGYSTSISMSAGSARGAMVMFGLMISEDGMYSVTPLGRALRTPVSENQRDFLRIVAYLNPERFREVYCRFKGQRIERRVYLRNLAAQDFELTDKVSRKFERVFIESGLHAGLLKKEDNAIEILDITPALSEFDAGLEHLDQLSADEQAMERFLHILDTNMERYSKAPTEVSESSAFTESDPIPSEMASADRPSDKEQHQINLTSLSKKPLVHEADDRILPCHNLALDTQMNILKAIVIHYENKKSSASRSDIASIVDVSEKNVGSCTSFWRSLGFISGEGDEWIPNPPLVEFVSNMEWGRPKDAKRILRENVMNAWFGRHAVSSLSVKNELTKEELMNALGRASEMNIGKETTRTRLRYLVELLELSGLVQEYDSETYRISPDLGRVRIGTPEQGQQLASLQSKSAMSGKIRTSYFEIGRLMGNLEQLGIHAEKKQISRITRELMDHLHPFDDLLLLLEALENNYILAAENDNPSIYLSNLSFLMDKIREKLGISKEREDRQDAG